MAARVHQRRPAEARRWTTFPVIEIFGPTVQGEGPEAGRPAYFVRFGGCDFRCVWCDSMYAVDPVQVRTASQRLDAPQIIGRIEALTSGPTLIVLTGGNPALLDLKELVEELHGRDFQVAVETQGSVWRPWLAAVDSLVVSPKPPSSRMDTPAHRAQFDAFMAAALETAIEPALKVVVFDEADLRWSEDVADRYPELPFFVSTGTDVGQASDATRDALLSRYRWLCESVARSPQLHRARVLPQLHVLAWGTVRGV